MISSVIKKALLVSFAVLTLLVISFFILLEKQLQKPLTFDETQIITVDKGISVGTFAKKLVNNEWIENRFWLRAYARLYPNQVRIKAGTYQLPVSISLKGLLTLLTQGKEHQFQLTFIEGSTFKQWLAQLKQQPQLSYTLSSLTITQIAHKFGIEQSNPEGWFFPETYAFTQGTTDVELLARAHDKMKGKLDELWQQRATKLPYKNSYEALIMASIIEKETSHIPEQPLIASVFINRLAKRMRLQTDPTVIYGLGERYQGDITRAHLREKTLYNTYRINGLPPTPIAMPSLSALQAALNPATSEYYYFVSGGNGKHVFSKTLQEHNIAVRNYLAKQRNK